MTVRDAGDLFLRVTSLFAFRANWTGQPVVECGQAGWLTAHTSTPEMWRGPTRFSCFLYKEDKCVRESAAARMLYCLAPSTGWLTGQE